MQRIVQAMIVTLLTGTMLAGCDYSFQSYKPLEFAANEQTAKGNAQYLDDTVDDKHGDRDANTAVDIAARLSQKYGESVDKLNDLQAKHQSLIEKDKSSQNQIAKLQLDLGSAEKELTEANTMLLEMQEELVKWKKDVLSFRDEMRQSQKATLQGVTRLYVLISGGVGMETPTTQPAQAVANTKEKTGETLQ